MPITPMQEIRAHFAADLGATLKALHVSRPDLDEAWYILALYIGYSDPANDLGIAPVAVINCRQVT